VRVKSSPLDFFGRLNARMEYPLAGAWDGRTTNRLYYYTSSGWRNDLRQYFDRPLGERWLFRARTRVQHGEEKNYSPAMEQKFSLAHRIDDRSAIVYESFWQRDSAEDSPYHESGIDLPSRQHYDSVVVRLRYRRNVWRPWMFVEVWPGVSWMEELDWEPSAGIRLRLELNVGAPVRRSSASEG
jgi:hypothetical protein